MESETQECTNCLKPFPVDRIDLHQAYCCRNIRKCRQCAAMVDIKDQEAHDKDYHDKKECSMCNSMIEPEQLATHQNSCPRRPKFCQFCDNSWPQVEFHRHVESCGARTKPCTVCHKNIMLKDFEEHAGRCERRRQERAEVSQDHNRGIRRNERNGADRQRQNSTNNMREPIKSTSVNKIVKPSAFKPSNMIGPQVIRPSIDPVPISVRIALKGRQQPRIPLKSKN